MGWEEKLSISEENIDSGRVNGLRCNFYHVSLATKNGVGGIAIVGLKEHYQRVHVKLYWHTD